MRNMVKVLALGFKLKSVFNLYAEYFMRNAGLDEAQDGIRIAGRNKNSLRFPNDTTLLAEMRKN